MDLIYYKWGLGIDPFQITLLRFIMKEAWLVDVIAKRDNVSAESRKMFWDLTEGRMWAMDEVKKLMGDVFSDFEDEHFVIKIDSMEIA